MEVVSLSEAKTQLAALVERAAKGEDVAISVDGVPTALLTRLAARKRPLKFGLLQGRVVVPEDFDEPLLPDVLKRFVEPALPRHISVKSAAGIAFMAAIRVNSEP